MRPFPRLALWTLAGTILLGLVAVVAVRLWFYASLESGAFHQRIGLETGRALRAADAGLLPIHLTGATLYSDGFEANGSNASFFSKLRAEGLRADFNWRGLLRREWQIDSLAIQRLDVELADQQHRPGASALPPAPGARGAAGGGPEEATRAKPAGARRAWSLDLRQAVIQESRWSWGGDRNLGDGSQPGSATAGAEAPSAAAATASNTGSFSGAAISLTPSGTAWLIKVHGGQIVQSGWPVVRVETARLRYQGASLFLTESLLRSGEGTLAASGEVNFARGADLRVRLDGVDVSPLLTPDWRVRLKGRLSGEADVHLPLDGGGADNGPPRLDGQSAVALNGTVRLTDGRLEALPVLDQIAAFTRTQRFRRMPLTQASMVFTRDARGKISAHNVVVESEGLMRIEGTFTIISGRISGAFEVGVTPSSLQWIPGSQERIFTEARGGYLWAPMRLSGPLEQPSEDLTPRLAAAAGESILEKFEGLDESVRDAAKGVLDMLLR